MIDRDDPEYGDVFKELEDMTKLVKELEDMTKLAWEHSGPTTVELVDECDEHGLVVFKDKDGKPFMWMPRADYESLKARTIIK